jgi:hypothetical protein
MLTAVNSRSRSIEVARVMLKGAVWALHKEQGLARDDKRIDDARANVQFWRDRMRHLVLAAPAS